MKVGDYVLIKHINNELPSQYGVLKEIEYDDGTKILYIQLSQGKSLVYKEEYILKCSSNIEDIIIPESITYNGTYITFDQINKYGFNKDKA